MSKKGSNSMRSQELKSNQWTKIVITLNGGRKHGHTGMVVDDAEYIIFSRNVTPFMNSMSSGPYRTAIDADAIIQECQIAEHKAKIVKYETYLGVESNFCRMIVKSGDHEWIAEVKSKMMGFGHLSPKALLTHLRSIGGSLDHIDVM
ncbi:hypothetical protein ACHAW6_003573 [Cyclotella cf. meneghiniana]